MPQIFYASGREIHRDGFREDDREVKQRRIFEDFKRVLEKAGLSEVQQKVTGEDYKVTVEVKIHGRTEILKVDHKKDGKVTGISLNRNDVELALWLKDLIHRHGQDIYEFYLHAVEQPASLALVGATPGRSSSSRFPQTDWQETEGRRAEKRVDQYLTQQGLGPGVDWFNREGESQIPVDFLVNGWLLEVKSTRGMREHQVLTARERKLARTHPDRYLLTLLTFHQESCALNHYRLRGSTFQSWPEAEFLQALQTAQPGWEELRQELLAMKVQAPTAPAEAAPEVQPSLPAPGFPEVEQGSEPQEPVKRLREKRKWSPAHWLWNKSKWHAQKDKIE